MAAMAAPEPDPLRETGRYEKIQTLGKGAFGFVQLARNLQTGELAAVKLLKRSDVTKYVEAEIINHHQVSACFFWGGGGEGWGLRLCAFAVVQRPAAPPQGSHVAAA